MGSGLDAGATVSSFNDQVDQLKRRLICDALFRARGDVRRAAEDLGIPRRSLYHHLKKFELDPAEYRELDQGEG
jgi:two-component system C4-dicarboxylate transport response regulator DctD